MRKAADGTGEAVALVQTEAGVPGLPGPDWSRDGRYLVYQQTSATGGSVSVAGIWGSSDVMYVEIGADGTAGEPLAFLATPANEAAPKLSPDGRFVAYSSDESGRQEVYLRPFPSGAGRWQASVAGGGQPRWSRDGKELFYVRDTTLMSVSVATGQGVTLGQPHELFQSIDLQAQIVMPVFDISADGQRFLTVAPVEQRAEAAPPTIRIVQNWYEEFRDRER
jgi:Tol biopolymer transport system component